MDFNKNHTIEQLPKWLNLVIGLAILWVVYCFIFDGSAADSPSSKKSKKSTRHENLEDPSSGLDMSYFLYGKKTTHDNGETTISKFSLSNLDDIELRGTMISEEETESVAFLHDPHEGSKILKVGDTYLEATLTQISHKGVSFSKGEEVINKRIKIASSGGPMKSKRSKGSSRKKRRKKR